MTMEAWDGVSSFKSCLSTVVSLHLSYMGCDREAVSAILGLIESSEDCAHLKHCSLMAVHYS